MTNCSNTTCKFCKFDTEQGCCICSGVPDIVPWSTDVYEWVVRCQSYKKVREQGVKPPLFDESILPNGLYPGQLSEQVEPKPEPTTKEVEEACLT